MCHCSQDVLMRRKRGWGSERERERRGKKEVIGEEREEEEGGEMRERSECNG